MTIPPAHVKRFESALARFDAENAHDPNLAEHGEARVPRELLYSQWLTDWVLRLAPDASEALRLAARCQHLCRWEIPRETYPMTRPGYLCWREDLKKFHAAKAAEILRETGYPDEVISRVSSLNLKQNLGADPEVQVLEDALCLVFLEKQLGALVAKMPEEKLVVAIRKSWNKMSPRGRAMAMELKFPPRQKALVDKALSGPPTEHE